jgi:hypothetical protein
MGGPFSSIVGALGPRYPIPRGATPSAVEAFEHVLLPIQKLVFLEGTPSVRLHYLLQLHLFNILKGNITVLPVDGLIEQADGLSEFSDVTIIYLFVSWCFLL